MSGKNKVTTCDWCGNILLSSKNVKFIKLESGIETRCYKCFLVSDKTLEWIPEDYEIKKGDNFND